MPTKTAESIIDALQKQREEDRLEEAQRVQRQLFPLFMFGVFTGIVIALAAPLNFMLGALTTIMFGDCIKQGSGKVREFIVSNMSNLISACAQKLPARFMPKGEPFVFFPAETGEETP